MSQKGLDKTTIEDIKVLWQYHIPLKTIAKALDINYPLIALYCRGFKAISKQKSPEEIVKDIRSLDK